MRTLRLEYLPHNSDNQDSDPAINMTVEKGYFSPSEIIPLQKSTCPITRFPGWKLLLIETCREAY